MEKTVMTVREMGDALGICYPKALELTERTGFPCIRIGRRKVIPCDGFKRWLDAQTEPRSPELAGAGAQARRS